MQRTVFDVSFHFNFGSKWIWFWQFNRNPKDYRARRNSGFIHLPWIIESEEAWLFYLLCIVETRTKLMMLLSPWPAVMFPRIQYWPLIGCCLLMQPSDWPVLMISLQQLSRSMQYFAMDSIFPGVQELLRWRGLQAGVSPHAYLQPRELPVGEGPQGQVRIRRHLRQGVSRAPPQGQRSLRQVLSGEIQSKFF